MFDDILFKYKINSYEVGIIFATYNKTRAKCTSQAVPCRLLLNIGWHTMEEIC